jgi:hypothetical protein
MALDLSGLTVRVESAVIPPFSIEPFASSDETSSGPSLLERLIKPKVVVNGADGRPLYTIAPAGDPPQTPWTGIAVAGAIIGGLVVVFLLGRLSAK